VTEGDSLKSLSWRGLSSLLLANFSIAVGFGIVLPILPFVIERVAASTPIELQSRHVGLLTATYVIAIFLFAPLWGRVSDQKGPRPVILLGLVGFATSLVLFSFAQNLPILYLTRTLQGFFAAAVVPTTYALVGERTLTKQSRARRFALINVAATAGFLVGPLLGSMFLWATRALSASGETAFSAPLIATGVLSFTAGLMVLASVPAIGKVSTKSLAGPERRRNQSVLWRLWIVAFVTAFAIGAFEVGLSLRGKQTMGLDYQIGLLFAECSLVMLIAQAILISPFVDPNVTNRYLSPALVGLAIGLTLVPLADSYFATILAVGLIAGSAGILSPIVTYWVSLSAGTSQGRDLGRATSVASLGQASGSLAGGMLFDVSFAAGAPFLFAAAIVLGALAASSGLSKLVAQPRYARRAT
jgi:MFS transporter, DHA1 family, multidrug resistance protein